MTKFTSMSHHPPRLPAFMLSSPPLVLVCSTSTGLLFITFLPQVPTRKGAALSGWEQTLCGAAARDPMLGGEGEGLSPSKGTIPASQGGLPEKLFLSLLLARKEIVN